MKRPPDGNLLVPPHLSDTAVLAYLDGELSGTAAEQAKCHLAKCWSCRSWMSAVEKNIDRFVRARAAVLPDVESGHEQRVNQFRERLSRHAAARTQDYGGAAWSARWQRVLQGWGAAIAAHRQAAIAATVAVCIMVVMFTDALNTKVSADTVFRNVETFEGKHQAGDGQVTRASVRIEKLNARQGTRRDLGTVTVLRDSQSPALVVTSRPADGRPLEVVLPASVRVSAEIPSILPQEEGFPLPLVQYLAKQQWVPDGSAHEFEKLLAGRGNTEANGKKDGSEFDLHYPFAAGHTSGISEALLRVNSSDYAPLGVSLFTQPEGDEYRFTRTGFEVAPRTVEIARVFKADVPELTGRANSVPALPKAVPVPYANSRASQEEVAVAEALHGVDACLGEEVHIFPMSDGSLLVQGLVDKAERKNAIQAALRHVDANLRIEVYLPRELRSGSELFSPPDVTADGQTVELPSSEATLADLSSGRVPLYAQMREHFARPQQDAEETERQINAYSNEVVTLARQTFLHAWALKRLDVEFAPQRTAGLAPELLQEVAKIKGDHRRWIATITQRQAQMLSELPGADASAAAAAEARASEKSDSDTILRLAREQNDLVRSLFTTSTTRQETEPGLDRLLAVLRRMGS
jgi:hypothetical protein